MSNIGLYRAFEAKGINTEQTAVGDKYVCENMMKNGHILGGEQSGHIIFSKYACAGLYFSFINKFNPFSYAAIGFCVIKFL